MTEKVYIRQDKHLQIEFQATDPKNEESEKVTSLKIKRSEKWN